MKSWSSTSSHVSSKREREIYVKIDNRIEYNQKQMTRAIHMLTAVRNCDMQKEPLIDPKVVSLASYKQKVLQDQDVKMLDYTPSESDVIAFLHVLRFLQKKTASEQVEIDSNADGITISLTEYKSDDEDPDASTVEYTTISHKTFVPFPFMLVDIDPSELTVHESGKNTVELFAASAATMMTRLEAGGK